MRKSGSLNPRAQTTSRAALFCAKQGANWSSVLLPLSHPSASQVPLVKLQSIPDTALVPLTMCRLACHWHKEIIENDSEENLFWGGKGICWGK